MATKLGLYNAALRALGETPIAALTESRASRRTLDSVYDDTFLRAVLEAGQWNFAARTREVTYSPSVTPSFGFSRAFEQPTDFVRLCGISTDEYLQVPLLDYADETGYWWCDHDTIYVKYVSDDSAYGADLSAWPATFAVYAGLYLAEKAAPSINADREKAVVALAGRALKDALSKDAMAEATKFQPQGSWASAALGRWRFPRSRIGFER